MMMRIEHKWELSPHTTPSGKILYHCPVCGLYDPAPVKAEFEERECAPGKYKGAFGVTPPAEGFGTIVYSRLVSR